MTYYISRLIGARKSSTLSVAAEIPLKALLIISAAHFRILIKPLMMWDRSIAGIFAGLNHAARPQKS